MREKIKNLKLVREYKKLKETIKPMTFNADSELVEAEIPKPVVRKRFR